MNKFKKIENQKYIEKVRISIYYELKKQNRKPKFFNKSSIYVKPSRIEAEASTYETLK